ncbi:MAG: D-alanyl-D-alanine carboxypeptidase [Bacilli bacterium]|nr:D-alanyl-D-alanine carboxypeptidase [Bacilli bacterium]
MKKYIIAFLCFFFIIGATVYAESFELKSAHALLINLDEQKILYEKDADTKTSIASLTKIMTAIVTLENISSLDDSVILNEKDFRGLAEANAAVAGFQIGEKVTYRDLLYGLMLPSGAEAAQALTRVVANNRETFVAKMNEKAKELGLTNTNFINETGLDVENHYSSLKDVAKMFQYALQNEEFKKIIQSSSYQVSNGSKTLHSTVSRNMKKNNITMDYLIGGKTGTTENAGLCLASIASANGSNYMLITTGAPQENNNPYNFLDTKTIYDYYIEHFEIQTLVEEGEEILTLNTRYAKEEQLSFQSPESISKYLLKDYPKNEVKMEYLGVQEINYDTPQNTKLGTLKIIVEGETLKTLDIILTEQLHFDIQKYLIANPIVIVCALLLIFVLITSIYFSIKKRKTKKG